MKIRTVVLALIAVALIGVFAWRYSVNQKDAEMLGEATQRLIKSREATDRREAESARIQLEILKLKKELAR